MKARKIASLAGIVILVIIVTMLSNFYMLKPQPSATAETPKTAETVYQRVMRTGTIRCAYGEYPPFFQKDPNTGVPSGISVEVMAALGAALNLKIEYTEEVPWGSIIEGFTSDRYDAFCADLWANGSRARQINFSIPFNYTPFNAYVRAEDKRFDGNLPAIDDPAVRIATMDGEMGDIIARQHFAKATRVPMPPGTDILNCC